MSDLINVTVRDTADNAILTNGAGTIARNRVTINGAWNPNPVNGQNYKIVSDNRSPLEGSCVGFENNQGTFNIR
jgi:hypothetical protein